MGYTASTDHKRRGTQYAMNSDTIVDLIQRVGCWCPSALTSNTAHHGQPINDYDTACRSLSVCMHKASSCSSGACYSGNTNEGFSNAFVAEDSDQGFACRATNACDNAVCMCQ